MPRGNAPQTKIHYQGKDEDFIVFVESKEELQKWKGDKSIPLAEVMSGFKVFVTNKYAPVPPLQTYRPSSYSTASPVPRFDLHASL